MIDTALEKGKEREEGKANEMLIFWKGASNRPKTDGPSAGYYLTLIILSFVLSWFLDFRLLIFLPNIETPLRFCSQRMSSV